MIRLRMREDVAMERPDARRLAVHDHVIALAGSDIQRVTLPRSGHRPPVLGDHGHVHAVEVHRMNHHAFVHEADAQLLARLYLHRLGCREALPVAGVAVRTVVENERVIHVSSLDLRRIPGLDEKGAEQSEPYLLRCVVMRVIHVRAMVAERNREFVGVALARLHWWLRDERNAVHVVWKLESMKVYGGRLLELVVQDESHAVSLAYADLRSRNLSVVRPRFDLLPGRCLPLNLLGRELED